MWESTSFLDVWVATPHKVAIPCNQQPAPGAAALAVQVPPAYQDFFLFSFDQLKVYPAGESTIRHLRSRASGDDTAYHLMRTEISLLPVPRLSHFPCSDMW